MPTITTAGATSAPLIIFAHGAGAGMHSDFMEQATERLLQADLQVLRFEFDYMSKIRETGRKRPPDRLPKLIEQFQAVIEHASTTPALLLGKSMGGRIATMVGRQFGLPSAALGYPFHAIGRSVQSERIEHLQRPGAPVTIFQGTLDNMGSQEEITPIQETFANLQLHWFEAANHDLKPRASTGLAQDDYLDRACAAVAQLIAQP